MGAHQFLLTYYELEDILFLQENRKEKGVVNSYENIDKGKICAASHAGFGAE